MSGIIWTTERFSCPDCGLPYTATREDQLYKHSGSFSCEVCGANVHAWSGNYDFFGWKVDQPTSPAFGKRWANETSVSPSAERERRRRQRLRLGSEV